MGISVITKSRAQSILYEYADSFFDRKRTVLIPCNTCESVPLTYLMLGIPFEMVDADPLTMSISLDSVEDKLKKQEKTYQGLHYVCNYGILNDSILHRIRLLKQTYRLHIILDKCLCIPPESVRVQDKELSADLEVYSTGGRKSVDMGGGGFGFTDSNLIPQWHSRCFLSSAQDYRQMKTVFQTSLEQWESCSRLQWLEDKPLEDSHTYFLELAERRKRVLSHKQKLNSIYSERIPSELQVGAYANDWRFQTRLSNRDEVLQLIFKNDLFASNHYRPWGKGVFTPTSYPVAEKIHKEILNLFNDFYFTEDQAVRTAEIIREKGEPCINAL